MGVILLATTCGLALSYELLRLAILFVVRNRVVNSWEQTTGEVVERRRISSVGTIDNNERTSRFPYDTSRVRVRYDVSGVWYETTNVNLLDFLHTFNYSRKDDRRIQCQLERNGHIGLHYNPDYPEIAVVRPTIAMRVWTEVLIVALGLVALLPVYQWYAAAGQAPSPSGAFNSFLVGSVLGLAAGIRVFRKGYANLEPKPESGS